jgi:transposase
MQEIIKRDETLNHLYSLITSVDGVGPVLATEMIITTNEFKRFASASKFACYCGVAPFEHTSGSSVKGKTRVSKIADKHIKAILHIAALSSIKMKGEIREYYLRKAAEGHKKMAVINAVRNKLIHRIFSCVLHDRPYQKVLITSSVAQ